MLLETKAELYTRNDIEFFFYKKCSKKELSYLEWCKEAEEQIKKWEKK